MVNPLTRRGTRMNTARAHNWECEGQATLTSDPNFNLARIRNMRQEPCVFPRYLAVMIQPARDVGRGRDGVYERKWGCQIWCHLRTQGIRVSHHQLVADKDKSWLGKTETVGIILQPCKMLHIPAHALTWLYAMYEQRRNHHHHHLSLPRWWIKNGLQARVVSFYRCLRFLYRRLQPPTLPHPHPYLRPASCHQSGAVVHVRKQYSPRCFIDLMC